MKSVPTTTLQSEQLTSLPLYCAARRCPKGFYSAIWAAGLAVGLGSTTCVAVRRSLDCCGLLRAAPHIHQHTHLCGGRFFLGALTQSPSCMVSGLGSMPVQPGGSRA